MMHWWRAHVPPMNTNQPAPQPYSFRLTPETMRQMRELARTWGESQTQTLARCVERAYQNERKLNMNAEWDRYMGRDVTPAEYAAQGGTHESIINDLREMWGPGSLAQGDDRMTDEEIRDIAAELASQLPA